VTKIYLSRLLYKFDNLTVIYIYAKEKREFTKKSSIMKRRKNFKLEPVTSTISHNLGFY
jgi:hypothetical protein